MVHSLAPTTPALIIPTATPFSISTQRKPTHLSFQRVWSCRSHKDSVRDSSQDLLISFTHRRSIAFGLVGVVVGLSMMGEEEKANAAARRPPPPPPQERKDPNVSGLMAKVLASKKRKEAMNESIAKLREKGKEIN